MINPINNPRNTTPKEISLIIAFLLISGLYRHNYGYIKDDPKWQEHSLLSQHSFLLMFTASEILLPVFILGLIGLTMYASRNTEPRQPPYRIRRGELYVLVTQEEYAYLERELNRRPTLV